MTNTRLLSELETAATVAAADLLHIKDAITGKDEKVTVTAFVAADVHTLSGARHTGTLAYTQLPTGTGSWDVGSAGVLTITGAVLITNKTAGSAGDDQFDGRGGFDVQSAVRSTRGGAATIPHFAGRYLGASATVPAYPASGALMGFVTMQAWNEAGTAWVQGTLIESASTETWTATARGSRLSFYTNQITTTTAFEVLRLTAPVAAGVATVFGNIELDGASRILSFTSATGDKTILTAGTTDLVLSPGGIIRAPTSLAYGVLAGDPSGVANFAHVYVKDVSASGELFLRNEAGLVGQIAYGGGSTFTITNDATDRGYNANATTLDELADVVATLIRDLAGTFRLPQAA